ncbi:hypothetical protein H2O64_04310 [Kordia sp. YSTF-M3]|uniref:Cytochrome c domain-containing protein n=1 Tax=Kordia aestuariivivens TaxID=2759037 RepID=A0ABR7Q5N6_9FLAO|nr:hypothetical protein [Kordia aestuariivivens]MBC8753880.1 hypothetical protein [Kordia aestuariivivens]
MRHFYGKIIMINLGIIPVLMTLHSTANTFQTNASIHQTATTTSTEKAFFVLTNKCNVCHQKKRTATSINMDYFHKK